MSDDISDGEEPPDQWSDGGPTTRNSSVTDNLDATFSYLSDSRRRYLLYYLFTVDASVVEFDAAVNAIRQYETAGTASDDPPSREAIRSDLCDEYLPRLKSAGVLDFDPRHGTIRFGGHPPFEEWVEHARHREME